MATVNNIFHIGAGIGWMVVKLRCEKDKITIRMICMSIISEVEGLGEYVSLAITIADCVIIFVASFWPMMLANELCSSNLCVSVEGNVFIEKCRSFRMIDSKNFLKILALCSHHKFHNLHVTQIQICAFAVMN